MHTIKTKSGKIAFLFTSLNNYHLFDGIFFSRTFVDLSDCYIFNIDLNSTEEQKEIAKEVFKKHDIINIEVDAGDPNLYSVARSIELCIEFIDKNNLDIDWVTWLVHDCHLVGDNFLERTEEILKNNPRFLSEVGMISPAEYNTVKVGEPYYGRGNLVEGIDGWWNNLPKEYVEADYFVVEGPQDDCVLVNKELWKKHINPDYDFVLFYWTEDISQQFALKNIPCIAIPSVAVADLYRLKPMFNASRSLEANSNFHKDDYTKKEWLDKWYQKYGFKSRDNKDTIREIVRNKMSHMYANTLVDKMVDWNISDGPRTLDDLKE